MHCASIYGLAQVGTADGRRRCHSGLAPAVPTKPRQAPVVVDERFVDECARSAAACFDRFPQPSLRSFVDEVETWATAI